MVEDDAALCALNGELFDALEEGFADQLDVMELPMEPLSRTISLTARKGILQDMPGRVAETLRPILRKSVVEPALARYPFLQDALTVI